MKAEQLIDNVVAWSRHDKRVLAVALCGSWARGEQRPDSDIDVCILCSEPASLLENRDWIDAVGSGARIAGPVEDYKLVQSLRVFYGETEIEFGITDVEWAKPPIDDETADVIGDGLTILYDPQGLLQAAVAYCTGLHD